MKEVDYKLLRLLDLIIKEKGFERAANKLNITQSAVSQKIKQFESQIGELLLIRTVPPRPTEYGRKLLKLLYHVDLIEHDMLGDDNDQIIPISVNADSLATWFFPALKDFLSDSHIRLDITVDDEAKTLDHMLRGDVVGSISQQSLPVIGGTCDYLGCVDYIFVASPTFAQKYFKSGVTQDALLKAPIVSFNHTTDMHHLFLQQYFSLTPGSLLSHIVPSSEAYIQLVLQDSACCMIPRQQIKDEMERGRIINLVPNLVQYKKLYWHRYLPESETMQKMSNHIINNAKKFLL